MIIFGLVTLILSAAVVLGGAWYIRHSMQSSVGSETETIAAEIRRLGDQAQEMLQRVDNYGSKAQFETVAKMLQQLQTEIMQEQKALQETEGKLNKAQIDVEAKEGHQQSLKTAREGEEESLEELLATFPEVSDESRQLERRLADSLKELDQMLEELELTADQRDVLDQLSRAMSSAGSLLRDLITEHAALHERLEMLKLQHHDLEDEYTKLVEQQLGE